MTLKWNLEIVINGVHVKLCLFGSRIILFVEENHDEVDVVDQDLKLLLVHLLEVYVLVRCVLVLKQELEHLLLVVYIPGVEDGGGVAEEGEGGKVPERVVLCQQGVYDPHEPSLNPIKSCHKSDRDGPDPKQIRLVINQL